jgi:hypothetical protein
MTEQPKVIVIAANLHGLISERSAEYRANHYADLLSGKVMPVDGEDRLVLALRGNEKIKEILGQNPRMIAHVDQQPVLAPLASLRAAGTNGSPPDLLVFANYWGGSVWAAQDYLARQSYCLENPDHGRGMRSGEIPGKNLLKALGTARQSLRADGLVVSLEKISSPYSEAMQQAALGALRQRLAPAAAYQALFREAGFEILSAEYSKLPSVEPSYFTLIAAPSAKPSAAPSAKP